ncbi:cytochrome P450 4F8-like isoform X2 [Clavelina lepadiformis]|uniref:cytochrome P450 4F8-like isoform X2 n=1 Tax=Clavelina lepadiformis TaxID=159417 RepID=UPI00404369AD
MDVVVRIIVALCIIAFFYLIKLFMPLFAMRRKGQAMLKGIDSTKPHWLLGHLLERALTQEKFLELAKRTRQYPKLKPFWLGPFKWFLTCIHPDVIKPILESAEPKENMSYGCLKAWIGDGLLVSSGKKWHRNRHLLTKAFHFDILKGYTKLFNHCAATMLEKWNQKLSENPTEIENDISLMTMDSMLQCIMSHKTNCQVDSNRNEYVAALRSLAELFVSRMYNLLLHSDFMYFNSPSGKKFAKLCKYVHDVDERIIEERRASINAAIQQAECDQLTDDESVDVYKKITGKRLDFLDILLLTKDENGNGLSQLEIRNEVDTFSFAGSDTTASSLSWALYCLALHPDYQEKCREDVKHVIANKKTVDWEDLGNFNYLVKFIKEVMRLYPPAYGMARTLSQPMNFPRGFGKDQKDLEGIVPDDSCSRTLEAGSSCDINIFAVHRNRSIWKNPDVFDPERFTQENIKTRSPYAYIPFSAGPRNCIGKNFAMAEIKVVLAKALQQFRFSTDSECPKPEFQPLMTLKPKNGIFIKIEKLNE